MSIDSNLVLRHILEAFEEPYHILRVYIETLKMDYWEIDQCYSHLSLLQ